ncbi:MAG: NAD-dependent epimerase/dehydratase family protein [Rhizobiaceae bacterium]|nr:NAD-dependent epimerase/dehydratase family protein [Rhizobiaceae bacterium]
MVTKIVKNRKNILVTGANGFLGSALMNYLHQRKWPVLAGTRDGNSRAPVPQVTYGTLPEISDITVQLSKVETVIHCAAQVHVLKDNNSLGGWDEHLKVNKDGTFALAKQAISAGVKRFIFVSTIGVHGNETTRRGFAADDIPAPHSPYAVSKLAAEDCLRELAEKTSLEVVILRPPLILGPNPQGNLATISRLLSYGLPLPFASATKNKRSLVSLQTLSSLLELCIHHESAPGKVFLVADKQPMHTRAIIERVALDNGQKARLFWVPVNLLRNVLSIAGKKNLSTQLFGDLEVNYSQTTKHLGWTPPI